MAEESWTNISAGRRSSPEGIICPVDIKSKNLDIKVSGNDSFLESPSSGTLKVKRLESQIILKSLGGFGTDMVYYCFSHYYGVLTPLNQWWTNL